MNIRTLVCGLALGLLALGSWSATSAASAEQTFYVSASSLNCRAEPEASATVLIKLGRGAVVSADERQGEWVRVRPNDLPCWVAKRYLSTEFVPTATSRTSRVTSGVRSSSSYSASSRSSRPAARLPAKPRRHYDAGECPCSGNTVCIGPRGGRYCITSGGNKRYGV